MLFAVSADTATAVADSRSSSGTTYIYKGIWGLPWGVWIALVGACLSIVGGGFRAYNGVVKRLDTQEVELENVRLQAENERLQLRRDIANDATQDTLEAKILLEMNIRLSRIEGRLGLEPTPNNLNDP